ncbi:MAG: terminase TerL endonuclease subunit [Clostridia bacterium]
MLQKNFNNAHIQAYVKMVRNDAAPKAPYPVCKEQVTLIDFVEERLDEPGVTLDNELLERYLKLQKYFPFQLFEWEVFVFALHCCTFRADGRPRFPALFLNVGRGAGKNGYLAFEDFCLLSEVHGITNYNIELCANAEEQAERTFKDIYCILEYAAPEHRRILSQHFYWNKELIRSKKTGSELKFRTSSPKTKDSLRSGKVDFDEIHQYTDRKSMDTLLSGLGKVRNPRETYLGTNGKVRDSVFDRMLENNLLILNGKQADNGTLPFISRVDNQEEMNDERMWHKANPSLRYMPDLLDVMQREYAKIKTGESGKIEFAAKRMNRPLDLNDEEALTSWANIQRASAREVPIFNGQKGVAGIDYASLNDFAAAVVIVREGTTIYVKTHSWVCRQSRDLNHIKAPLDDWASLNLLTWVDAPEIPPEAVVGWIVEQSSRVNIQAVGMDRFRYALLRNALEKKRLTNIRFVSGADVIRVAPVIESYFNNGYFAFGDNPLFRWYCNNTKRVSDGRNKDIGNWTYGKIERFSRKNDGFMGLVAALCLLDELPSEIDINLDAAPGVFVYD